MRDSKQEVLKFWFEETLPVQWFQSNQVFDDEVRSRFLCTYEMALKGMCNDWLQDADGALAMCIVLDQFPRNMFRGTSKAFSSDANALSVAKEAVYKGFDKIIPTERRIFFYLPFEHSESLSDQEKSLSLFSTLRNKNPMAYYYAERHHDEIKRFGRFPQRNNILGRQSRSEEIEYLEKEGR